MIENEVLTAEQEKQINEAYDKMLDAADSVKGEMTAEQEKKIKELKSEIEAEESNFSNIMNIITDLEIHECNDMAKELEKTKAEEIKKRIADLEKQLQDVKNGKDKKSSKEETNFNEVKDDVKTTEETSFKEV